MPHKCKDCGEEAVISGVDVPSGCHVCTACGAIADYCDLSTEQTFEGSVFIDKSREKNATIVLNRSSKYHPRGVSRVAPRHGFKGVRKEGLEWLQQAALHFKLDKRLIDSAETTYTELVHMTGSAGLRCKTSLAAACCYVVMRSENWPVSLKELSNFVQCPVGDINAAVLFVQKQVGAEFERTSSDDLLSTLIKHYEFDDRDQVLLRARELLKVADMCWQTEGRSPQNVASVVIYLAWKSLDACRTSVQYRTFCSKVGIKMSRPVQDLAASFVKLLVQLAEKIPWVNKKVTSSNVTVFVPDIVKHTASLILDCTVSKGDKTEDSTDPRDLEVYKTFRRSRPRKRPHSDSATTEYDSDISDSEIDRYIRTPSEVEAVKNHLMSRGLLQ